MRESIAKKQEDGVERIQWNDDSKAEEFIRTLLQYELGRIYASPFPLPTAQVIVDLENHLKVDCGYPKDVSVSITDINAEEKYTIKVSTRYPVSHQLFTIKDIK